MTHPERDLEPESLTSQQLGEMIDQVLELKYCHWREDVQALEYMQTMLNRGIKLKLKPDTQAQIILNRICANQIDLWVGDDTRSHDQPPRELD